MKVLIQSKTNRRSVTTSRSRTKKNSSRKAGIQSGINLMETPTNHANDAGASGGFGGGSMAGPTAGFDPVLISLIRRAMPNLVAYDLAGVQPMNGPTGLIFAMRSRYSSQSGTGPSSTKSIPHSLVRMMVTI